MSLAPSDEGTFVILPTEEEGGNERGRERGEREGEERFVDITFIAG